MRRPQLGRLRDHARDTPRARAAGRARARGRAAPGSTSRTGSRVIPRSRRLPADRRDASVRVLHVVDGVLHRLRGDDVEVEGLRGVDALQQEREPGDVGIDLVEDVGERDDVPGPLRDPDELAAAHQLHQLAEQHLGLTRRVAERLHARLERLHLPVVVGAPDVDEVLPPAVELVAVVREVVAEIGGGAVGLHEHAVALVAEVGGAQPGGAVVLERRRRVRRRSSSTASTSPRLVQRALREPRVEVHADAIEVVLERLRRRRGSPTRAPAPR